MTIVTRSRYSTYDYSRTIVGTYETIVYALTGKIRNTHAQYTNLVTDAQPFAREIHTTHTLYAVRRASHRHRTCSSTHPHYTHTQCTVRTLGHRSFVGPQIRNTQYANWVTAFRSIHSCAFQYSNFNTLRSTLRYRI